MHESFKDFRFVWKQVPGENPEAKDALNGQKIKWGTSKAIENLKKRVTEGSETKDAPEKPRERAQNISINPTPEILDGLPADDGSGPEHGIRKRLQYIFDKEFPRNWASHFSPAVLDDYKNLLHDLPEGMLMQAITENGSEEELIDRFEGRLREFRYQAEKTNVFEDFWELLKDLTKWVFNGKDWKLEGENPFVQKGPIKPRHKVGVIPELKKLEDYYKARLEEKHGHWYGDNYNKDRVEFFEEMEADFYREYYLNLAIVEKRHPYDLVVNYSDFLKQRFRETLEDQADKNQQLIDDQNEKKGFEWINIVKAIEAGCK